MSDPERSLANDRGASAWRMGLAVRAHVLSQPFDWLLRAARIVASALPIGLLRRADIDEVVHRAYAEAPDFYDPDTYPIRYEEQLLPILVNTIGSMQGRRLLDLYCGHGREAEIFARAGFQVLGVDAQPAVIERARTYAQESGFDAEFIHANVDEWRPDANDWDVVYTSLWMYSTIPDRDARYAWLRRLWDWVAPGGCLVISVTPGSDGAGTTLRHAVARAVGLLTLNSRRPEKGDRFHTGLFWHDFTDAGLREELHAAGLAVVESLPIDTGTRCHFYVLRRPGADG